ncbi:hypothetical protein CYMTET_44401 [Cymbomonas tetramitiformis]|uniref:AP2/ERF domain-containing protein n=1 Tax=Cymbomonas tetramitiformis TaxID=36881 RepID=A0AAE0EZ30_9CHLO|nr:hypothetical protein CYMTET_44401 [Cymbomonas tetramitiformis]
MRKFNAGDKVSLAAHLFDNPDFKTSDGNEWRWSYRTYGKGWRHAKVFGEVLSYSGERQRSQANNVLVRWQDGDESEACMSQLTRVHAEEEVGGAQPGVPGLPASGASGATGRPAEEMLPSRIEVNGVTLDRNEANNALEMYQRLFPTEAVVDHAASAEAASEELGMHGTECTPLHDVMSDKGAVNAKAVQGGKKRPPSERNEPRAPPNNPKRARPNRSRGPSLQMPDHAGKGAASAKAAQAGDARLNMRKFNAGDKVSLAAHLFDNPNLKTGDGNEWRWSYRTYGKGWRYAKVFGEVLSYSGERQRSQANNVLVRWQDGDESEACVSQLTRVHAEEEVGGAQPGVPGLPASGASGATGRPAEEMLPSRIEVNGVTLDRNEANNALEMYQRLFPTEAVVDHAASAEAASEELGMHGTECTPLHDVMSDKGAVNAKAVQGGKKRPPSERNEPRAPPNNPKRARPNRSRGPSLQMPDHAGKGAASAKAAQAGDARLNMRKFNAGDKVSLAAHLFDNPNLKTGDGNEWRWSYRTYGKGWRHAKVFGEVLSYSGKRQRSQANNVLVRWQDGDESEACVSQLTRVHAENIPRDLSGIPSSSLQADATAVAKSRAAPTASTEVSSRTAVTSLFDANSRDSRKHKKRQASSKKWKGRGTSKYLGVYWCKRARHWKASIAAGSRSGRYLGGFHDEVEAAHAFDRASRETRGNQTHKVNFHLGYKKRCEEQISKCRKESLHKAAGKKHCDQLTSKYRGVSLNRTTGKWRAQLNLPIAQLQAKGIQSAAIAEFADERLAALAYDYASRTVRGTDTLLVNFLC